MFSTQAWACVNLSAAAVAADPAQFLDDRLRCSAATRPTPAASQKRKTPCAEISDCTNCAMTTAMGVAPDIPIPCMWSTNASACVNESSGLMPANHISGTEAFKKCPGYTPAAAAEAAAAGAPPATAGLSAGAIAGIAVGCAVAALGAAAFGYHARKRALAGEPVLTMRALKW